MSIFSPNVRLEFSHDNVIDHLHDIEYMVFRSTNQINNAMQNISHEMLFVCLLSLQLFQYIIYVSACEFSSHKEVHTHSLCIGMCVYTKSMMEMVKYRIMTDVCTEQWT